MTLLAGNLFSSTIDKSYIAASYNFDLHVFLIVPSKQLNAKLTGPGGYVKRISTLMEELVSNDNQNNFPSMSLCILVSLVSPFFLYFN